MGIKVGKRDAIWSYLATILSFGLNIILVPMVLVYLNDDETALYYIFTSLSAIAALLDFGFSPSIARGMAYAWSGQKTLVKEGIVSNNVAEPNYLLMAKVASACKILYSILAVFALILAVSCGTIYISHITKADPHNSYIVAWLIYAVAIFLNILFNYYSVFLRGVGAIAAVNKTTVISKFCQLVICVGLLVFGVGLIGVSIAYLLFGVCYRFFARYYFNRFKGIGIKLKEIHVDNKKEETIKILKTIWPNTWKEGLVTFSNYILNQATTIISSLFVSLQETGTFSLCTQLTTIIATVAATMYTTYQPSLQSSYASGDKYAQKRYMSFIVVSYILIYIVGFIGLTTVGLPIVAILKPSYTIPISLLFAVGFYQFILKFRNCYTTYISSTNRLIYWKHFVISAFICITLSLVLDGIFDMGVWGLIIAQIFSQIIYNAWHWTLFVHKELELSIREMISLSILEGKELIKSRTSK